MRGDRSVLLFVVCFISGLVIGCVVSVDGHSSAQNMLILEEVQ